jgi:hypothetical protein
VIVLCLLAASTSCRAKDADGWAKETYGEGPALATKTEAWTAYQLANDVPGGARPVDKGALSRPFLIFKKGPFVVEGEQTPLVYHRLSKHLEGAATSADAARGFVVVEYRNQAKNVEIVRVRGGGHSVKMDWDELMMVTFLDRDKQASSLIAVAGHDDDLLVEALRATPARP